MFNFCVGVGKSNATQSVYLSRPEPAHTQCCYCQPRLGCRRHREPAHRRHRGTFRCWRKRGRWLGRGSVGGLAVGAVTFIPDRAAASSVHGCLTELTRVCRAFPTSLCRAPFFARCDHVRLRLSPRSSLICLKRVYGVSVVHCVAGRKPHAPE